MPATVVQKIPNIQEHSASQFEILNTSEQTRKIPMAIDMLA